MSIAGLAFLNPLLLLGMLSLPVIWWLLRTVPPAPRRVAFPATRILVGLENQEKQSDTTPWWLMLIRLLAAALLILALAEPVFNPTRKAAVTGTGPVVIVVDNGWSAASRWSERAQLVERLIGEAEAQRRAVVVAGTAHGARTTTFRVEAPGQARSTAAALQPQPFEPARMDTITALEAAIPSPSGVSVVWLADGIDHDTRAREFADRLARLAGSGGSAAIVEVPAGQEALGLAANLGQGGRLEAIVVRAMGAERTAMVHALSNRGQRLGEARVSFSSGSTRAETRFELPLELRNQIARIEVAGERSAGAVHLLDARAQWHRVGLLSGASREQAQPLLAPLYYLERALLPFAELAKTEETNLATAIEGLMKRNVSVLTLADVGTLPREIRQKVDEWVKKGGVLVRFAGPRLENGGDELVPSVLRVGGRSLGGALSWSTPQPLAPFTDDSLFVGLPIPPDVTVNRQVLADPARLGADVKTWAKLRDGTPLVTARRHGDGQLVLFHVTANSDWSSLPLSGLFVDMLRRIATLGKAGGVSSTADPDIAARTDAAAAEAADVLAPQQTLDGFGVLRNPPPTAEAIPSARLGDLKPSATNPPGYYGPQGSPRALNLVSQKTTLAPLPSLPGSFERRLFDGAAARNYKPDLLAAALGLLFVDILATLALAGAFSALRRASRGATTAALLIATLAAAATTSLPTTPAAAQDAPQFAQQMPGPFTPPVTRPNRQQQLQQPPPAPPTGPDARSITATGRVTFGYVRTGDPAADRLSEQGLKGLNVFLIAKTAVEPGEPMAVDIERDEIAFFPMLFWPVLPTARPLGEATLAKIDAYMKNGGMIIFDTRDAGTSFAPSGFTTQGDRGNALQRLLGNLDIPRLEPVPETHVLTKSFYLLRQFPGRFDNGQLWVEVEAPADTGRGRQARRVDGVSTILVTSNDFASAWALDERNQPLYPVIPGGERQRELAFRAGVNIVMYALTGNYKADQVHVPALLERLGN